MSTSLFLTTVTPKIAKHYGFGRNFFFLYYGLELITVKTVVKTNFQ